VLLTGKIDKRAHQLAIASLFTTIAILGLPAINLFILAALIALGIADELLNDYSEKNRVPLFSFVAEHRLILDLGALAISIVTGEWAYFLAMASFDLSYQLTGFLAGKPNRSLPGVEGHHLLLDLYDCDVKRLEDARLIKQILRDLPARVGMKRISEPLVKKYESKTDEGLTGFVLLAESHCSVHTYPRFATVHCDVFSCKLFEAMEIANYLKKKFKAKKMIQRVVVRSEN
jgi:S-adenosylmethionine decarboxylase